MAACRPAVLGWSVLSRAQRHDAGRGGRAPRLSPDLSEAHPTLELTQSSGKWPGCSTRSRTFAGTPEQIADTIERWGAQGAADGFNIMPAVLPAGFDLFAEHVVPILRQRGLLRLEYAGTTLREHYGLPRPPSRYAAAPAATFLASPGAATPEGAVT